MLDQQMKPANAGSRTALRASTVLTAAGIVLAGGPAAGQVQEEPRWKRPSDYSSAKDWNLKAENIVPHGLNPLYYPIVPGHKHAHERPDHPDGFYRKETVVLNDTEDFDLPGIGKFKTAVVQGEAYIDGVLMQRGLNWLALDKTTNSVYAFGEVSWEINEEGKPVFGGTWRAGEPDGENSLADPGLLMPGTFTIGGRYIFDGSRSIAYGGSENIEAGIEITVPAGAVKNKSPVRGKGLLNPKHITYNTRSPVGVLFS